MIEYSDLSQFSFVVDYVPCGSKTIVARAGSDGNVTTFYSRKNMSKNKCF